MIRGDEREVLNFLITVADGPEYSRWARFTQPGAGATKGDRLAASTPDGAPTRTSLWCDREVVLALHRRGYIDGEISGTPGATSRLTISRAGRALQARGFVESPSPPPGGQDPMSGAPLGNVAPMLLQYGDLAPLLASLRAAIVADSNAPEEARHDAALDADIVEAEMKKKRPDVERILRYIEAIPVALGSVTTVAESAGKLHRAISARTGR
jgi:hypothetical protein